MLKLDCSYGTGGGQIIRSALALSTLSKKPFEAKNIRQGRKVSGLKAQHVYCIKALQKLANSKASLAVIGSEYLTYIPGELKGQTISIDIGTSGSISLLLQATLLPALFCKEKSKFKITGGTSGKWAMPYDFFANVFLPQIRKFSESMEIKLEKRGYFPKGGGKVELTITPKENKDLKIDNVEQGHLLHIKGISHASKDLEGAKVSERQTKSAKSLLIKYNVPVEIQTVYSDTLSTGSGITLWAIFSKDKDEIDIHNPIRLGADSLGERGKRAEDVGSEAAERLIQEIDSGAPIDKHTADNLIPFLAMFGGRIKVSKITNHTKTNIWICEQFLDKKFSIDEENKIISI